MRSSDEKNNPQEAKIITIDITSAPSVPPLVPVRTQTSSTTRFLREFTTKELVKYHAPRAELEKQIVKHKCAYRYYFAENLSAKYVPNLPFLVFQTNTNGEGIQAVAKLFKYTM